MSTIHIIRKKAARSKQRSGDRRGARAAFSLLVVIFLVTTAFVYALTPVAEPRRQEFSLTATAIMPAPSISNASLEKTILSEANLARAVGAISSLGQEFKSNERESLSGRPIESIRRDISVKTSKLAASKGEGVAAGQAEVSITYNGQGNAGEARRLVNLLAEQTAREDADRRRATAALAHQKAKKSADVAHSELLKAQAQYDAFLDQHFSSDRASPPAAAAGDDGQTSPGPLPPGAGLSRPMPGLHFARPDWAGPPKSPTLNNARWTELNNKLAELVARRAALLERMTPAHPEVENIDLEIEDMERMISSLPRELPCPLRDSLPPIEPMPPDPSDDLLAPGGEGRESGVLSQTHSDSQPQAELQKEFRRKQEALDAAREKYNRLAAAEREAWQALLNVGEAEVIMAVCPKTVMAAASGGEPWFIIAALIVGLFSAAGVGLFSLGVSPPACFANAAEVRAVLKAPVVGTMPAVDPPGSGELLQRTAVDGRAMASSIVLLFLAVVLFAVVVF